jgi:3-carboxy-cis,cis-muconate cycloisomerase
LTSEPTSLIRGLAASTPEMLAAFGDATLIRAALDFEAALATAEAAEGLLTAEEAKAVADACRELPPVPELARAAAHAGTLAIPLVAEIRGRLTGDRLGAATKVHLGATSQDVADTALVLQAKAGCALIRRDAGRLAETLAELAAAHRTTPMAGRTLLQQARPITLGLKAANWLLGVTDALRRLEREAEAALTLQLGGAAGTLEGLDGKGAAVSARVARALDLGLPPLPWHGRREALAGLGSALAILTGALGKIARDVALLAQSEVGEASEPFAEGRGGSSAMPHKRNPTGCQVALSAAIRTPHLAAALLSALPQEHERGLGGWQAEAPVLAELFALTHGALAAMLVVVEGLEVHTDRMAANLAAADIGEDVGEAGRMVDSALATWRNGTSARTDMEPENG